MRQNTQTAVNICPSCYIFFNNNMMAYLKSTYFTTINVAPFGRQPQINCVAKILSNLNRFATVFHWQILQQLCSKVDYSENRLRIDSSWHFLHPLIPQQKTFGNKCNIFCYMPDALPVMQMIMSKHRNKIKKALTQLQKITQ